MPASALEGRDIMFSWMQAQQPLSVVDVGPGEGTYGRMFRRLYRRPYLIGIEAWKPYVQRFDLTTVYDLVIQRDIRELTIHEWPRTDVVILGDVLEHMTVQEAQRVWSLARSSAHKAVYLSIPIVRSPQGAVHGNPFETHVVEDWSHEKVLDAFPGITWHWQGTIVGRYEALRKKP